MAILEVKDLKFSYDNTGLYKSINFSIQHKEHVVLVGPNGSGKSTFMKLIAKILNPDSGTIEWLNGIKYSYLDQNLEVKKDVPIKDYLYGVYKELFDREERLNKLYMDAANLQGDAQDKMLEEAENLRLSLEMDDFYNIETEINNCIVGLGLSKLDLSSQISILSGGEKAKVYLAKILLEKPDCILMDEPTNFLDKTHIEWLENYLNNFNGAFLIISHDQEFLKSIAKVVYAIENKEFNRYKGDYEFYLRERVVRFDQQLKNYNKQQEYIKRTKIFIEKNIVRATTSKRAKSRRKQLEKLDIIEAPKTEGTVKINFPFSRDLPMDVLTIKDLEIGYNNTPLLEPLSIKISKGERVEIIGKNGIGKTTLIKTILGEIDKISGEYKFSPSVDINYFSQEEDIDLSINAIDYYRLRYPHMVKEDILKNLARIGIRGELPLRPLKELSGGELERIRLSLMTLKKSNILILDEPTNHLDKKTKDALHDAIDEYPGSIILVSHEKGFADDLVDIIIKF